LRLCVWGEGIRWRWRWSDSCKVLRFAKNDSRRKRVKQIPFGDDNKNGKNKSNGKNDGKCGFFAVLRMTRGGELLAFDDIQGEAG
jgi:hypothetical protein